MALVLGNTVSIAAASITNIGQFPERSSVGLAEEALESALKGARLTRPDIDGLVWNLGSGLGANYDTICAELGPSRLRRTDLDARPVYRDVPGTRRDGRGVRGRHDGCLPWRHQGRPLPGTR